LRSDLDRLMEVAIIPERARRSAADADPDAVRLALAAEWKAIKAKWGSKDVTDALRYFLNSAAIVAALSASWPA
jgi:hypothetical protein